MVRTAIHRAIKRGGRDVELTLKEKTGSDDYGNNYSDTTESPITARARVDYGGRGDPSRDRRSSTTEIDATAYFAPRPDDASDFAFVYDGTRYGWQPDGSSGSTSVEPRDGAGDGAMRVTIDGVEHVALSIVVQDDGLLRVEARRKT